MVLRILRMNQSRPHPGNQLQFLFIEKISRYFKMKVRHPIVMFQKITPYLFCMGVMTVKRAVYKFYLRHFLVKEELKLLFHQIQITKAQTLVH